jgi:ribonuclease BN (tRNA processing enzyme)
VDLDVVFLGTAASAPTAHRSTPALLVRRGGERLLVDCGEGTQRQLQRSSVGPSISRRSSSRTSTPTTSSGCPGC